MSPESTNSSSANDLSHSAPSEAAELALSQAKGTPSCATNTAGQGHAPTEVNGVSRCQHRTATGRRCRIRVADPQSPLCFRHLALCTARGIQVGHQLPDVSPDLVGGLTDFQSAVNINKVLS